MERDGGFTVHGCGALYCELDVRIDCIKMAMDRMKKKKTCQCSFSAQRTYIKTLF